MFAGYFGGWEVVLIFAVVLILYGAKKLPEITRGLREGFSQFRKRADRLPGELDRAAHDAGESLGGIYGRPAAQALTPDNQTAELYDPAAFQNPKTSRATRRMRFRGWRRLGWLIRRFVSKCLDQFSQGVTRRR